MSRKPDMGLRSDLHSKVPLSDGWVWSAIETGTTSGGIPDSKFLHRPTGSFGWVESKATDGWKVKFEPHQINWFRIHSPFERTFVLIRATGVGSSGGKGDSLRLYSGACVDILAEFGLQSSVRPLIEFLGPKRSFPWGAIAEALIKA